MSLYRCYIYKFIGVGPQKYTSPPTEIHLSKEVVRLTECEGWRIVHVIPYPSTEPTRALLLVLERPVEPADPADRKANHE